MSTITQLQIEAFKRITAVTVKPDGSVVTVGGRNGAGKSSTLDAIEAALGGGKRQPAEPIHKGRKKARVVVETDDLVVTRRWTSKDSKLEVTTRDGGKVASPQTMLDELVGPISFDPLAFTRKKPQEQADILRAVVGLDFTDEDAKRQQAYDKRTTVGREVKRLQGAVDSLPEVPDDTPAEELSVAELADELDRRQRQNAVQDKEREDLDALRRRAVESQSEIERLEEKLAAERKRFEELNTEGKALAEKVSAHVWADVDEVRDQIANLEETNRAVRAKAERENLEAELDAQRDESDKLTEYIEQIDAVKADAIAQAQYPIEGLAITDEGLTLNGHPFEQASQAEQLRASVAIAMAQNPKLRVMLVRDGSLLDEDSLAALAQAAEDAGAQVWLERVSETGEGCSVVIEDGAVAGESAA